MAVRFFLDYMREQMEAVARHKWFLSEKAGRDVGWNVTVLDFVEKGYAARFHDEYFKKHNITSIDGEVNEVMNGDACVVVELRAIAHNHETGKEAVLEDAVSKYCFGGKDNCLFRRDNSGVRVCERKI